MQHTLCNPDLACYDFLESETLKEPDQTRLHHKKKEDSQS